MARPASSFRVGVWTVEPALNRVSRDGESAQLELKVMDVLVCLAEHAGELVPREVIVDTVWATEFIADNTLTHAITEIRRALGDDARDPCYIETIPKRGYRLIAPVTVETGTVTPFPVEASRPADERSPYPGLAAFTEDDAEFFFGREAEVAQLWRKLTSRRLLAVIGPSGVGKSSFVRAGVVPAAPEGWATRVITPGESPLTSLARGLVYEFSGDAAATEQLVDLRDPERAIAMVARWRDRHHRALLVVDQLEELFTLASEAVQEEFANLLRRLVDDAGIHVLLVMRDDFLHRCHDFVGLAPVFDSLTPIAQPVPEALRRALVEPAARVGYGFEGADLVDEMVAEVAEARAALPLLAFAVARLWDARDRERQLLTREAYEAIGGVGGALARRAEATLQPIGSERLPIVRDLFRNLVTAQGTRAVREIDELLSVFDERSRPLARDVLSRLVDARLLTAFDEESGDRRRRRVEIVHEALLDRWPRLLAWRTQDAGDAQFRDELRQAARTWAEHDRSDNLLWTGSAYREFGVWRERYPGGLTDTEEAFGEAMARVATRRRRRRRIAVVAAFAVLVLVSVIVGMSRQQAVAEARRAEAGKLVALARGEIGRYPTAALAYTRASLGLADTPEARRLAVEVLWRAPVARILPVQRIATERGLPEKNHTDGIALSPDGRWLALRSVGDYVLVFESTGGAPRLHPPPPDGSLRLLGFGPRSSLLAAGGPGQSVSLLSLPELREQRRVDLGGVTSWGVVSGDRLVTLTLGTADDTRPLMRIWPFTGGETQQGVRQDWPDPWDVDPRQGRIVYGDGSSLVLRPLGGAPSSERVVGTLDAEVRTVSFMGEDEVVSVDGSGEIRVWSLPEGETRVLAPPADRAGDTADIGGGAGTLAAVDARGRRVAVLGPNASVDVWHLVDPPDVEPVRLSRPVANQGAFAAFVPGGAWLAVTNTFDVAFWPMEGAWMRTLRRDGQTTMGSVSFSPDTRWLASSLGDLGVRLRPLHVEDGSPRVLLPGRHCGVVRFHPDGERVLVGTMRGDVFLVPLSGGSPHRLETGWEGEVQMTGGLALDATGRLAAAAPFDMNPSLRDPRLRVLRVWDLASGEGKTYSLAHLTDESWWGFFQLRFLPDGSLLAAGPGADGVFRLVLPPRDEGEVTAETLASAQDSWIDLSAEGGRALVWGPPELHLLDLATGRSRGIDTHGDQIWSHAIDPTGEIIVTGDTEGVVRVGPATGEEPHLLLGGHEGVVWSVDISPDGRWIASVGDDGIRLWPMPDMTRPPLHTLAHDELLAKLDELTNLRAVRDETSSTGWTLEVGPFPGWETGPTW